MLRIDLTPYPEGVHPLALEVEAQALDLDPDLFADIHVEGLLDVRRDRALVSFEARARATLECDRTLARFTQPIAGSYRILFAPESLARRPDTEEDDCEEVRLLDAAERTIDLTDAVRDTLLLAVPPRKVAPGAEDLDLPTVFGAPTAEGEPPIDPRWEALRALRSDDDGA